MKQFNIIAAVALNGVIGDSITNAMPWYLPTDLAHFKNVTFNKTVVMGSKTFHSVGKPLKDRRNVVITRNPIDGKELISNYGVDVAYSDFSEVVKYEKDGFFVIGGSHIYGDAIRRTPVCFYITLINSNVEGDVKFPIAGQRFVSDTLVLQNGDKYVCSNRSNWLKENGFEFQFTEFRLNN